MTNKMRFSNDGALQTDMASINCTFLKNPVLKYHMLYLDQTFYQLLLMVAKYVLTYNQGTVKLDFNHTAPLDPVPVCSFILPPTRSNYCGQLVVNSQYRLTVNTPFSQDAVTGILRIKQLVAVYTDPVLHR